MYFKEIDLDKEIEHLKDIYKEKYLFDFYKTIINENTFFKYILSYVSRKNDIFICTTYICEQLFSTINLAKKLIKKTFYILTTQE